MSKQPYSHHYHHHHHSLTRSMRRARRNSLSEDRSEVRLHKVGSRPKQSQTSQRRHFCDHEGCTKAYMRLEHLTRHQLNHVGVAIQCKYCDKTFTRNDLLQRHLDRHERSDGNNKRSLRHKTMILVNSSTTSSGGSGSSSNQVGEPENASDPFVAPTNLHPACSPVMGADAGGSAAAAGTLVLTNSAISQDHHHHHRHQHHVQQSPVATPQTVLSSRQSQKRNHETDESSLHDAQRYASDSAMPTLGSSRSGRGGRQHHMENNPSQVIPAATYAPVTADVAAWPSDVPPSTVSPNMLRLQYDSHFYANGDTQTYAMDAANINWNWILGINGLFEEPPATTMPGLYHSAISSPEATPPILTMESPVVGDVLIPTQTMSDLLKLLPAELSAQPWFLPHNVQQTVKLALDSLESAMPLLHRPSLEFRPSRLDLLLVLVSYGFLVQSLQPDTWQIGLHLHKIARKRLHHPDILTSHVNLQFLQAMLLHELVGTYLCCRDEHEKADILHGQLIRIARRSDLVWSAIELPVLPGRTEEQKWRDWVDRESTKRLAHFIFALDVQHVVHFSHGSVLTIDDMKNTLPCIDEIWSAPTAGHWRAARSRLLGGQDESAWKLRDVVEAIIARDVSGLAEHRFTSLQMYIIIHGLLSVAAQHVERRAGSGSIFNQRRGSQTFADIWNERVAIDGALDFYESMLNVLEAQAAPIGRTASASAFSTNARLYCRLACSYLHVSPQDIEMAAGSLHSGGRIVLRERAQDAIRRVTSQVITLEQCEDSLRTIQDLCSDSTTILLDNSTVTAKELVVSPMLYSAALFVWAFLLCVKRDRGIEVTATSTSNSTTNATGAPLAGYSLSTPQDHVAVYPQFSSPPNAAASIVADGGGATGNGHATNDLTYAKEQCDLLRQHVRTGNLAGLDGIVQRILRCCFARMSYSRSAIVAEERLVVMKLSHDTSVPAAATAAANS